MLDNPSPYQCSCSKIVLLTLVVHVLITGMIVSIADSSKVVAEVAALRKEVGGLKTDLADIKALISKLCIGGGAAPAAACPAKAAAPAAAAKVSVSSCGPFVLKVGFVVRRRLYPACMGRPLDVVCRRPA